MCECEPICMPAALIFLICDFVKYPSFPIQSVTTKKVAVALFFNKIGKTISQSDEKPSSNVKQTISSVISEYEKAESIVLKLIPFIQKIERYWI